MGEKTGERAAGKQFGGEIAMAMMQWREASVMQRGLRATSSLLFRWRLTQISVPSPAATVGLRLRIDVRLFDSLLMPVQQRLGQVFEQGVDACTGLGGGEERVGVQGRGVAQGSVGVYEIGRGGRGRRRQRMMLLLAG